MRTYSQIAGDGGSDVAGQIAELDAAIARRLADVRFRVAVGSGKGGVGKSTLTRQLAAVLAAAGRRVGILDADLNGPSQALLGGVSGTPPLPGEEGLLVPRSRDGVQILSAGSLLGAGAALTFPGAETGHAHVWRATRELSNLAELLGAVHWGPLDLLLVDLPPGPERTAHFAEFLGEETAIVLVSVPSALARGVVARSIDALRPLSNRLLGYVENMSGYACPSCGEVGPLFPEEATAEALGLDCLGRIPFDPELARASDRGVALTESGAEAGTGADVRPVLAALRAVATELSKRLEETP
jgi:ATP-binding protein involved in chromosome partitioning